MRRKTRQIRLGKVKIGGGAAVSIQSMAKTDTKNLNATVKQIKNLTNIGCEVIRVAVKDKESAYALSKIKKRISIPLEADIHFDYRLALSAIEAGSDGIRLNPGNISKPHEVKEVIMSAKKKKIPIRIGVNSGSLPTIPRQARDPLPRDPERPKGVPSDRRESRAKPRGEAEGRTRGASSQQATSSQQAKAMVEAVSDYLKIFEKEHFYDIIISLKASDAITTILGYRKMAKICDYPFHLGVTATGAGTEGIIKSTIGIGTLLEEGIGDTIRVSLTAEPEEEVIVAKQILQALGLRRFGPDIISCPTCGRCQVDLVNIVKDVKKKLYAIRYTLYAKRLPSVAIMGCEVNGPGEARGADIGIAFGRDSGVLFKKGKIIKKIKVKDAVKELLNHL